MTNIDTLDWHVELLAQYQTDLNVLAEVAGEVVSDLFEQVATVDRSNIAEFRALASPTVNAARLEGIDLAAVLAREWSGADLPPLDPALLPGVPWEEPFLRTWHYMDIGLSPSNARAGGASVAESLGRDAPRDGAAARFGSTGAKPVGWQRVINANACEWCQVVSVQRYRSYESANFGHGGHGRRKNCGCVIVPVFGARDPGQTLNHQRLADLYGSGAVQRVNAARARTR